MPRRVLCVAEKNSVADGVARILNGGRPVRGEQTCARYCRAYRFQTTFPTLGPCDVTFTAVAGHLYELDFVGDARQWRGVDPAALYSAPVAKRVREENKPVERNLQECARSAEVLVLWLDCDREGENIAFEVIDACRKANPRLEVLRARFSSLSSPEIARALRSLGPPNEADARAVDARQEIDLRVGASFTRLQSLLLQDKFDWDAVDDDGGASGGWGSFNDNDENARPQHHNHRSSSSSSSNNSNSNGSKLISYGPCQFPTLGLIVSRCWEARAHVPEPFWFLSLVLPGVGAGGDGGDGGGDDGGDGPSSSSAPAAPAAPPVVFKWSRGQIFDQGIAAALYEAAAAASAASAAPPNGGGGGGGGSDGNGNGAVAAETNNSNPSPSPPSSPTQHRITAVITSVDGRQRHREPPAPLSTLELQKAATRRTVLGLPGDRVMKLAEELYQAGFLSYPRTETDEFDADFDLSSLVQAQCDDPRWGAYARRLAGGGDLWRFPRSGGHNDRAHPPIHPTKGVGSSYPADWCRDKQRLYEFVTRSFLAACSRPATGAETRVEACVGHERFCATGLMVTDRAWLDVYPYTNWGGGGGSGSGSVGSSSSSNNSLPPFAVGQRLVALELTLRSGATAPPPRLAEADLLAAMDRHGIGTDATMVDHIKTLLTRRYAVKDEGPGGGGGFFDPTPLGEALVSGYASLGLEGLWQPQLRSRIEAAIRAIASGAATKERVLSDARVAFERDFAAARAGAGTLVEEVARFFPRVGGGGGGGRGGGGGGGNSFADRNNNNDGDGDGGNSVSVGPCPAPGCSSALLVKHAPANPDVSSFGGAYLECSAAPLCSKTVALPPGTKVTTAATEASDGVGGASRCALCGGARLLFAFRRAAIPAGFDARLVACGTPGCDRMLRALLAACGDLRLPFARRGGGGGGNAVRFPTTTVTTTTTQWQQPPPPLPPPDHSRRPRGSASAAAGAPSTSSSQQQQQRPASRGRRNNSNSNASGIPRCPGHDLPLLHLTARTGDNAGRRFFKCSVEEENEKCLRFAWADEYEGGSGGGGGGGSGGRGSAARGRGSSGGGSGSGRRGGRATTLSSRGRGARGTSRGGNNNNNASSTRFVSAAGEGSGGMNCFNCGAPGHFASACPNR